MTICICHQKISAVNHYNSFSAKICPDDLLSEVIKAVF